MNLALEFYSKSAQTPPPISPKSAPNRPQIESKAASWRGPEGIPIWEASGAALGGSRGGSLGAPLGGLGLSWGGLGPSSVMFLDLRDFREFFWIFVDLN